jgi:hypothetical protein
METWKIDDYDTTQFCFHLLKIVSTRNPKVRTCVHQVPNSGSAWNLEKSVCDRDLHLAEAVDCLL